MGIDLSTIKREGGEEDEEGEGVGLKFSHVLKVPSAKALLSTAEIFLSLKEPLNIPEFEILLSTQRTCLQTFYFQIVSIKNRWWASRQKTNKKLTGYPLKNKNCGRPALVQIIF